MKLEISDVGVAVVKAIVALYSELGGRSLNTQAIIRGANGKKRGDNCKIDIMPGGRLESLEIRHDMDDWTIIATGNKPQIVRLAMILCGVIRPSVPVRIDGQYGGYTAIQAMFLDAT